MNKTVQSGPAQDPANAKERLLILGLSTDRLAAFAPPGLGG